ncbi:hypothetical protein VTJ83DRAFT_4866 [Remersonia thermophila]|uniref:G-patch domain-containing protein n=1 Tax=Remersonia thermophila TaxID=72144 RepID=A0ABR4DC36_9PEZI
MTSRRDANDEDDGYDDIPLHHQRPFGTGLHKKPIAFVSASSLSTVTQPPSSAASSQPAGASVADLYLSMVLPDDAAAAASAPRSASAPPSTAPAADPTSTTIPSEPTPSAATATTTSVPSQPCPVCSLPLPPSHDPAALAAHNTSLAHQLCLPYSPPPSALDRTRMGLTYLSAHGWDPDARRGLGAEEQGIQFPLKPRVREERLGLGAPAPARRPGEKGKDGEEASKKGRLLDAKKVRKMAAEDRKRREELREELFGDGKLEKYLGVGRAAQSAPPPGPRAAERRRGLGT